MRLPLISRTLRSFATGVFSAYLAYVLFKNNLLLSSIIISLSMLFSAFLSFYSWKIANKLGIKNALIVFNLISSVSAFLILNNIYMAVIFLLLGLNGTDIGPQFSLESTVLSSYGNNAKNFADYTLLSSLGIIIGNYASSFFLIRIIALLCLIANFAMFSKFKNEKIKEMSKIKVKEIRKLSGLFAIDAFGGGFIAQTLLAGLFVYHFHISLSEVGLLLSVANIATLASYHLSYLISKKIKIVRTMVFTHLASNVLLIVVGFAPIYIIAASLYIARNLLAEMDVPLRSVLTFKMVNKKERAQASSYTSGIRMFSQSASPWLSGIIGSFGFLYPLLLGGLIKSTYDLMLYKLYRNKA